MVDLVGSTVDLLVGSPITDRINPTDMNKVKRCTGGGSPGEKVAPSYEALLRPRDGSRVWVFLNVGVHRV